MSVRGVIRPASRGIKRGEIAAQIAPRRGCVTAGPLQTEARRVHRWAMRARMTVTLGLPGASDTLDDPRWFDGQVDSARVSLDTQGMTATHRAPAGHE
jgi:hypothetical protein